MPVNRFSVGALNGATPGLSRMAQALAGGGGAYQAGYDGELQGQSKMAQAIAAARASEAAARNSDAAARFNDEKAASEGAGRRVLESRPDLYEEQVAAASGTDIPLVRALRTQLRTGQAPVAPMGPPTEDGQMGAAPMQIDPAKASKITMALQSLLPLLANTGDLKPDDLAQARQLDRTSALSDAIIAGTANRNTVAGAQAAAAGKNQYNSDSTGAVLDLFGGQLATDNPMAQGTINLRKEQAGAQKANAVQSYASAGASNASAAKTRLETGLAKDAPKGVLVQTADGPVFADPRTGTSTPVTVNGVAVKPAKGKGMASMSATLQKELIEADDTAAIAQQTAATLRKALTLNDKAYSGYGAKQRAVAASNLIPGKTPEADATIELDNMIGEQALSGMKAIFGGNPTEGERAILLDLQASASKTPSQRKAIIERGIQLAERRAKLGVERAKSIRSGDYLTQGADAIDEPDPLTPDEAAELAALKKQLGR